MKRLINSVLHPLGIEVRRILPPSRSRLDKFFTVWSNIGIEPKSILDIGANRGNWTRKALAYFPEAIYLLIEPQEALNLYLTDLTSKPNIRVLNVGISDEAGHLPLAIPARDDSASFRGDATRNNPTIQVKVTTIDAVVQEWGRIPSICKIDAEGYDLKALHGAQSILGKTEVFLIEAAVCAYGLENTIERVVEFMGQHDYKVFDFTDLNDSPRDSVLWLVEIVFVKKWLNIWDRLQAYQ